MCVDFTDLNKACPKDSFPMPKIDQLVDATVSHPWMSFLDAFCRSASRSARRLLLLPLSGITIIR